MNKLIATAICAAFSQFALAATAAPTPLVRHVANDPQTDPANLNFTLTAQAIGSGYFIKSFNITLSPNAVAQYDDNVNGAVSSAASVKGSGAVFSGTSNGGSVTKCNAASSASPFADAATTKAAVILIDLDASGVMTGC
jgi:hypothetical protein